MAKPESKRLNVRLRLEAAFALEDLAGQWSCSQTAALERAILIAHEGATSFVGIQGFRVQGTQPETRIEAQSVPGVSVGLQSGHSSAPTIIKRYKCDHCGTNPAVARYGEICANCREAGHNNEPRNCGECQLRQGGL